jgi:hypothetical protein
MIGVPTHGFISGHSMPPTLPKSPQIENIYKNIIYIYIYQKNYNKKYISKSKYLFQITKKKLVEKFL